MPRPLFLNPPPNAPTFHVCDLRLKQLVRSFNFVRQRLNFQVLGLQLCLLFHTHTLHTPYTTHHTPFWVIFLLLIMCLPHWRKIIRAFQRMPAKKNCSKRINWIVIASDVRFLLQNPFSLKASILLKCLKCFIVVVSPIRELGIGGSLPACLPLNWFCPQSQSQLSHLLPPLDFPAQLSFPEGSPPP